MFTLHGNTATLRLTFYTLQDDECWNIYESQPAVVFLWLGLITAGAVGNMGFSFYHHSLHGTDKQPSVVCPMGAVRFIYFLTYFTPCSSGFSFSADIQTQHKAIVPVHLRGTYRQNNSVLPLRMWHARALWPELNHTAHLKRITGWANISSYGCSESHGHNHYIGLKSQLLRTNPQGFLFSPRLTLWQPHSIHSIFICA